MGVRAGRALSRGAAQEVQERASGDVGAPQSGQTRARGWPHAIQKRASLGFSWPQDEQRSTRLPAVRRPCPVKGTDEVPSGQGHPGDGLLTAVRRRSSHEGGQPYREQAKTGQPATLVRLATLVILRAHEASLKSRSARLLVKLS